MLTERRLILFKREPWIYGGRWRKMSPEKIAEIKFTCLYIAERLLKRGDVFTAEALMVDAQKLFEWVTKE